LSDFEFVAPPGKKTAFLGKGAFGEVQLVKSKIDNKLYALKQVILTFLLSNPLFSHFFTFSAGLEYQTNSAQQFFFLILEASFS